MKKYKIKNFSTTKLIIYGLISFVLIMLSTILTSVFISNKIYPAIVLLVLSLVSVIWIKHHCWNIYYISLDDGFITFNTKKKSLTEICNYSFSETEKFYGCKLVFKSYRIFLNIPKYESGEFKRFKFDFMEMIKVNNQNEANVKITEYNWYQQKSAKNYGFILIGIILIWIVIIVLFPNKLSLSKTGLFLMVITGLFPILCKIFNKSKDN